jgi:serine/threonine protein kinase/Tol biopolymer transport system component
LSTQERLELFGQVCNAVQHAHQKGIIHRDIKPSNVMVTLHDGTAVPKVIDFGIAKATNQRLTEKTVFTRYAQMIGTPAYMSPEQAEMSGLDVDTRTDIYSLGVLLYELLTGTTPFDAETLHSVGYFELQRIIREDEPLRPSTKLGTLRDSLIDVAKHRNTKPDLLRRTIRGDLDLIVMKSLEKDRTRRYETANGLREDIRRHLEHEPVLARGPSTTYRLHKFLRRHRSKTIAALAMLTIVGSLTIILSMWNRDRFQLAEAEGFAREQYAKMDRQAALETIKPILNSRHVGPEAQLLYADILVHNRRSDEAVAILGDLLNKQPEIAGAAHSLLARIIWENESPSAEKLKEIEEHRRRAEALLPETAEAYFLRAMTAVTVKEQIACLDRALQLDPGHYESRRLRAFTYYASRKYEKMKDDALVLTVLRPREPLGYSLRAIALCELGRHQKAITDFDTAIALTSHDSPQYFDLSTQRCETLLRKGDYERAITEAKKCLELSASSPVFQYHIFSALTALGDYDKTDALFRQIIASGYEARRQFQDWCMKYIFDTLEAGRPWHPTDREPAGAAFLPMVEAEETYHDLSVKAKRVIADGFSAQWSSDGKKLAFSLGVHGYSGVAVFDPATKETELLIVPGKDPRWSPDGRYIAFVRDCRFLRISEFIAAERKNQHRLLADEEVWVMNADGTQPRRLARGGWPSWSQDSTCIYYQSRVDRTLCSISIEGPNAKPKRIMACSNPFPSVSPDNQRVVYLENASLKVKDLASQILIAEQPAPFATWGYAGWSPTGQEWCLGGRNDSDDRTGLWIYSLDRSEPVRTLDGQITVGSWASDGTKLVFNLGPPYLEIWAAGLDPNISTIEALGPGRTLEEHYQEMVDHYTRIIKADPEDAHNYLHRAEQYQNLREKAKMRADMRRYYAILSQRPSRDLQVTTARKIRRILSGPFGYQAVFTVEERENDIQVPCIALGQKGRCNMKSFQIPMLSMSLLGVCLLSGLDTPPVHADFTLGEPINLGPMINSLGSEFAPSITADGLELYFSSYWSGGHDIWVSRRATTEDDWSYAVNLGSTVNSTFWDLGASISSDGLELYFNSGRSGGHGRGDLYMATRRTREDPWDPPVNLGPSVNSAYDETEPQISSDGLSLFFSDGDAGAPFRPGGQGQADIWVTTRASKQAEWGVPVNLGPVVNSSQHDTAPSLSTDGLSLFFGRGSFDVAEIWMSRRKHQSSWNCRVATTLGWANLISPTMDQLSTGPLIEPVESAYIQTYGRYQSSQ